ncbi:MAG: rhomboid family intramembrane serine protease [Candidatus Azobacteroides sp.]|nr:rhomboid family intramembrane serine protease [Candidatus Azobacteroides sp.]
MFNNSNNSFYGGIPVVTRNLLIINLIVWAACNLFKQLPLADILGLHDLNHGGFYFYQRFSFYQLITYQFTHTEFFHLFFNMFALYMFGRVLESYWGPSRFFTYYMVTGIGAGLIQLAVCYFQDIYSVTIGASGAVFGILLAFGMIFPNAPLMIIPIPFPIKAKYLVIGYGLLELSMGIADRSGDNVAHFAHLGGMLFGIILILYWRKNNGNFRSGNSGNRSWTKKIKDFFNKKPKMTVHKRPENDWDYNARKAEESKKIDHILEKIKYSGYNSLSEEEKKKLFDASKK